MADVGQRDGKRGTQPCAADRGGRHLDDAIAAHAGAAQAMHDARPRSRALHGQDAGIPQGVGHGAGVQACIRRDAAAQPVDLHAGDEALQFLAHFGHLVFNDVGADGRNADDRDQQDDGGDDRNFHQ
ncbi:hypothetical protein D9M68_720950 [compost metagenome]